MRHEDVIPPLLKALNENQLALAAAIEELAKWVGDRGSVDTVKNVYGALETLTHNQAFIDLSIALMMEPD
ncbi:hypothetical protein GNF76_22880 [Pseudomonas sp. CCM 7893]|uniref:Uncharacterized protein n=1 Tax=Pseudomonas spelaei TaxID=1055469 RepID=A0A6I3WJ30_9PSED|nr:hypothetical protein [Pseudomonas spelaei]MUF07202.1 hypothetical protein [Pseudomonas spelaei]QLG93486.1 hypothetical protein HZF02_16650 [Pseudomonas yamanorum]